jgi:type VI secretion system secreted protein Hcp
MALSRHFLRGSTVLGALTGLLCFAHGDAQAVEHLTREQAAPIYMKCDGLTKGAKSTRGNDWIEIKSFQLGSGSTTSAIGSGTSGAGAGKIKFNEGHSSAVGSFHITKLIDAASPSFYKAAAGKPDNCTVNLDKPNTSAMQPYMTINFENVMLSHYSLSSGGDRPTESVSFNFTKAEYKDNAQTGRSGTNLLAPPNALEIAKPKPSPSPSPVQPK